MMTLRQVEVIRAVMVTGTIGGAARLLNVSAPGISRLVKYTEKSLGDPLLPAPERPLFSDPGSPQHLRADQQRLREDG